MVEMYDLDEIVENTMNGLKDFQRATVDRIFKLYTEEDKDRILVSDEVGLGKTLVARGVIANYARYNYEHGDELFKIIYICSNSTIVDKNLNKLSITDRIQSEKGDTSRLSMQHLNIFLQNQNEIFFNKKGNEFRMQIQLIPLTPDTSFNYNIPTGTVDERALMFAILSKFPTLRDYSDYLEHIFRRVDKWDDERWFWEAEVKYCDNKSDGEYLSYLEDQLLCNYSDDVRDLERLCQRLKENKKVDNEEIKDIIVRFRGIFADISLEKLDPDLIILDEFQRFKPLLNSDENSDMGKIVKKLFYSNKILMLSATPYKMYSTLDEISKDKTDAHYSEFKDLIKFLKDDDAELENFMELWSDYSHQLKESDEDREAFISIKNKAECELYKNICRTERISEGNLDDIINSGDKDVQLNVSKEDIVPYMKFQKLLDDCEIKTNVPIDYVKSTPYLMSFMEGYELKRKIKKHLKEHPDDIERFNIESLWLNKSQIDNYSLIKFNNARLNNLMEHVFKNNASNLLWVPPSMPYYELDGAFKDCGNYSKTLIFSSWEMVPKMISSFVSYEFERRTIGQLDFHENYFSSRRTDSSLNIRFRGDIRNDLEIFALIYPSIFLSDAYDPIGCFNADKTLNTIENEVKEKIKNKLDSIQCDEDGGVDYRWYYLAPLLLDIEYDVDIGSWFNQFEQAFDSLDKIYKTQYKDFKRAYDGLKDNKLKRKPDDLVDVLCDIAIASPAVCAYRSYEKEISSESLRAKYLNTTSQIAMKFLNLMNHRESTVVLNLYFENDLAKPWRNILAYSKDGNLQAVFDEYVHLLSNEVHGHTENRILVINEKFLSAFKFRTTHNNKIDTFKSFKTEMEGGENKGVLLRNHYATSFSEVKGDKKDSNRKNTILDAFNSPFRPFVLSTTSIGQEGLDFHNYCRRIVHWNLPSNPIDLEQREGRVNRFECLSIRQNVAKKYGEEIRSRGADLKADLWKGLFNIASEKEKSEGCSDVIPHWGLKEYDENLKIERILPMYPVSTDEIKYDRLIKILSLYRLTLGQPRQEELIDSFLDKQDEDDDMEELFINLSPFYKKNKEDKC